MPLIFLLLLVGVANAEPQKIHQANINSAGQLVISRKVGNFGVVQDFYTIVIRVLEPTFCGIPDKRHMLYTQDYILVERTPAKQKLCPSWDFVKKKCHPKKK